MENSNLVLLQTAYGELLLSMTTVLGMESYLTIILRMPQRFKLNPLNESYFFFPYKSFLPHNL